MSTKGGKKWKGGGLAVPDFNPGNMQTPLPTLNIRGWETEYEGLGQHSVQDTLTQQISCSNAPPSVGTGLSPMYHVLDAKKTAHSPLSAYALS